MPSDKPKVVSYLEKAEKEVFDKFCDEHDYSNSQGVAHLIREGLIGNAWNEDNNSKLVECDNKLKQLENWTFERDTRITDNMLKNEVQEEQIAQLQEEISRLQRDMAKIPPQYFTDDEIASVTGRRLQEVYEWRLGIRKPRGKRVLEKLKAFEIVDGQWRKKTVGRH